MHSIARVMLLLRTEAKRFINQKRKVLFAGIVLIVLMISTFSYGQGQGAEEPRKYITIGVSNQDGSEYAALLLRYFKDNADFSKYVELKEGDEEALKSRFDAGGLDCLLVIPEGFAGQMIQMEHLPVRVWVSMEDATKALLLKNVLDGYETYIAAVEVNCAALYAKMEEDGFSYEELQKANVDISLELVFTALGKDSFFARRSIERRKEVPEAMGYLCGACYLFVLLSYFPAGARLREYVRSGMAGRMRILGIPYAAQSAALLVPHLLVTCLVAGLFAVFATGWSVLVFWMEVLLFAPVLLLVAVLGAACRKQQTYLLLYSLSFVGMALVGGSVLPVLYLPEEFLLVAKWLPNYQFQRLFTAGAGEVLSFAGGACAAMACLFLLLLFLMKQRGEETAHAG